MFVTKDFDNITEIIKVYVLEAYYLIPPSKASESLLIISVLPYWAPHFQWPHCPGFGHLVPGNSRVRV